MKLNSADGYSEGVGAVKFDFVVVGGKFSHSCCESLEHYNYCAREILS